METELGKSKILLQKMLIKKVNYLKKILIIFFLILPINNSSAEFFRDLSNIIEFNETRLSYGVSVTDINMDGNYEFIVTGFGYPNLALSYIDGKLKNIIQEDIFLDPDRKTIGVAACDIDKDGFEEIYFLNTDTYSCLLYTSPSPRDRTRSRMPSSA